VHGNSAERVGFFSDMRVVITGAAGTVGSELVRQLLSLPVAEIRALDNNENGLFFLNEEHKADPRFQTFMCDVRSEGKLERLFHGMDYAFHVAALKHVPLSERSPFETVQTNINGVQNVIRAALNNNIKRVLFTSSDKAVNPTNVMGTTKLMGERLMTAANALTNGVSDTIFTSTRFGNVAGSAGSVVPLFCQQIARGGPVTLTDAQMTRFLMTLEEAVHLVLHSMEIACGGEAFVTKMPVVRIRDIAEVLVDMVAPVYGRNPASIEIVEVGSRPGEKLFEELTTEEELRRTLELDDLFAVLPAFRNIYDRIKYAYPGDHARPATRVYNSAIEEPQNKAWVRSFLLRSGVLPVEVSNLMAVEKAGAA